MSKKINPNKENLHWNPEIQMKYQEVLKRMPIFARPMAEKLITKKAERNTVDNGQTIVGEKALIDAFFSETPFGFHGPMMTDLESVGLDYKKYGHPIDYTQGMFK